MEFNYRPPDVAGASGADRVQVERDLREISELLLAAVAGPERVIELRRDELLRRLGWPQRFEFRAVHEFPVPKDLYEPIQETREQVEAALASTERGYIAVIGTPGSGRSTLLTEVLRKRPERVIRYHAFVPDSQHPRALRGEAVSFLHDVVLVLERAGFRAGTGAGRAGSSSTAGTLSPPTHPAQSRLEGDRPGSDHSD